MHVHTHTHTSWLCRCFHVVQPVVSYQWISCYEKPFLNLKWLPETQTTHTRSCVTERQPLRQNCLSQVTFFCVCSCAAPIDRTSVKVLTLTLMGTLLKTSVCVCVRGIGFSAAGWITKCCVTGAEREKEERWIIILTYMSNQLCNALITLWILGGHKPNRHLMSDTAVDHLYKGQKQRERKKKERMRARKRYR